MKRTLILSLVFVLTIYSSVWAYDHPLNQTFYLNTQIEFGTAGDLVLALDNAYSWQTITVYVNSPGGSFSSAYDLTLHVRDTKADTIVIVKSAAASGAAMFLCPFKTIKLDPIAVILYHGLYKMGMLGQQIAIKPSEQPMFWEQYDVMYSICKAKHIVTEQEIKDIKEKDTQVFLQGKTINERMRGK